MARQPRFVLPGHPQHITQRGNELIKSQLNRQSEPKVRGGDWRSKDFKFNRV
jgi:hypothetical protein